MLSTEMNSETLKERQLSTTNIKNKKSLIDPIAEVET